MPIDNSAHGEVNAPIREIISLFRKHRKRVVAILSGNEAHTGEIIRELEPEMPLALRGAADRYFHRLWVHIGRLRLSSGPTKA